MKISHEELLQIISYDPQTGIFTWKARPVHNRGDSIANAKFAGKIAGSAGAYGYMQVALRINGKYHRFAAHRLAWLYVTGSWPPHAIDHINRNRADNRFSNLRLATDSENRMNTIAQSNSKSGIKGVSWDAINDRWRVNISKDGKVKNLGRYKSLEEAMDVRKRYATEWFGEFVNESSP